MMNLDVKIERPEKKYLWKYMDLFKFIHLIKTQELFFTSLDNFDDILEGTSERTAMMIKMGRQVADIPSKQRNPEIPENEYNEYGFGVLNLHEELKHFQKRFFVNCFYSSNTESEAMWNLYTGLQGLAIRFNSNKLFDYIKNYHHEKLKDNYTFGAGLLDYKNFSGLMLYDEDAKIIEHTLDKSPFMKNQIFEHENEYRFIFSRLSENSENPVVKLEDWSFLDISIIACPDLEEWKICLIEELIIDYIKKPLQIHKSDIITKKTLAKYKEDYLSTIFRKYGSLI